MENIWRKAQAARDRRLNFDSCLIVFSAHIEELKRIPINLKHIPRV
jgi:hypothetical protein